MVRDTGGGLRWRENNAVLQDKKISVLQVLEWEFLNRFAKLANAGPICTRYRPVVFSQLTDVKIFLCKLRTILQKILLKISKNIKNNNSIAYILYYVTSIRISLMYQT